MNDDWRLRIDLGEPERAHELTEELRAQTLEDEIERSLHDAVIVSVDGTEVFCYAGTREEAERARETVASLTTNHSWNPQIELTHWHPTAERWEDPEVPLPEDDAARAVERRDLIAQERADSASHGYPEYEVRIECASHGDASSLAERLRSEGVPVVARWRAVLVGATDEESAGQLADRLRAEVPAGSTLTVEGNRRAIYDEVPWHPFSIFGGMGG